MKTPKPRLAVLLPDCIHSSPADSSTFFELGFVQINDEDGKLDYITNPRSAIYGESPFTDLVIQAYVSWRRDEFSVSFRDALKYRNVHSIDATRAERMSKLLRKARSVKFPVEPETFGQFVVMMCAALGVREAVEPQPGEPYRAGAFYHENLWRITPVKDAQARIDFLLSELRKAKVSA